MNTFFEDYPKKIIKSGTIMKNRINKVINITFLDQKKERLAKKNEDLEENGFNFEKVDKYKFYICSKGNYKSNLNLNQINNRPKIESKIILQNKLLID